MGEDLNGARNPFLHLKESIGSLMFLWCELDDALSNALHGGMATVRRKGDGSFHERLVRLKATVENEVEADPTHTAAMAGLLTRLDEMRRLRNLIVHSLTGVCADPARGEPHLTCEDRVGTQPISVRITQTALTALLQDMNHCSWQLGNVAAGVRLAGSRS